MVALFARVPVDGNWLVDILPATLAASLGAGIGFNPILLAAMSGVGQQQAGLASGVVNTAFMMGGAVGLAALAAIADSRTQSLADSGDGALEALTGGYQLAFLVAAIFVIGSAVVGATLPRSEPMGAHAEEQAGPARRHQPHKPDRANGDAEIGERAARLQPRVGGSQ